MAEMAAMLGMRAKITSINAKSIPAPEKSARANLSPTTARLLGTAARRAFNEPLTVAGGVCRQCRSAFPSGVSAEGCCARSRLIANYAQWTSAGKLSAAAWERIRRLLLLGNSLPKLSDGKVSAAAAILAAFVEQFPLDEQTQLTEIQIAGWLLAADPLPLPSPLRKAIVASLRRIVRQTRSVPPVEPSGAILPAEMFSGDLPGAARRANKNGGAPKRRRITKVVFLELAVRQGMFCYWCEIPVVRESLIPLSRRIGKDETKLRYLDDDGRLRAEETATVDHLTRVIDGGDNRLSNLVISCYRCNLDREILTAAYLVKQRRAAARKNQPQDQRRERQNHRRRIQSRNFCAECGSGFCVADQNHCPVCGATAKKDGK